LEILCLPYGICFIKKINQHHVLFVWDMPKLSSVQSQEYQEPVISKIFSSIHMILF